MTITLRIVERMVTLLDITVLPRKQASNMKSVFYL